MAYLNSCLHGGLIINELIYDEPLSFWQSMVMVEHDSQFWVGLHIMNYCIMMNLHIINRDNGHCTFHDGTSRSIPTRNRYRSAIGYLWGRRKNKKQWLLARTCAVAQRFLDIAKSMMPFRISEPRLFWSTRWFFMASKVGGDSWWDQEQKE